MPRNLSATVSCFTALNGTANMSQLLGTFTNPNYYFGAYKYGPTTDWNKVLGFFNGNRGLFSHQVDREHPQHRLEQLRHFRARLCRIRDEYHHPGTRPLAGGCAFRVDESFVRRDTGEL